MLAAWASEALTRVAMRTAVTASLFIRCPNTCPAQTVRRGAVRGAPASELSAPDWVGWGRGRAQGIRRVRRVPGGGRRPLCVWDTGRGDARPQRVAGQVLCRVRARPP